MDNSLAEIRQEIKSQLDVLWPVNDFDPLRHLLKPVGSRLLLLHLQSRWKRGCNDSETLLEITRL